MAVVWQVFSVGAAAFGEALGLDVPAMVSVGRRAFHEPAVIVAALLREGVTTRQRAEREGQGCCYG